MILRTGGENLGPPITEVRRISRNLRPGVLDDRGPGPAIKTLAEDFRARTGLAMRFETVVFRNRLDREAKIALYRIAQDALTSIERHSGFTDVSIGRRNMQGRMDQLGGTLRVLSARGAATG